MIEPPGLILNLGLMEQRPTVNLPLPKLPIANLDKLVKTTLPVEAVFDGRLQLRAANGLITVILPSSTTPPAKLAQTVTLAMPHSGIAKAGGHLPLLEINGQNQPAGLQAQIIPNDPPAIIKTTHPVILPASIVRPDGQVSPPITIALQAMPDGRQSGPKPAVAPPKIEQPISQTIKPELSSKNQPMVLHYQPSANLAVKPSSTASFVPSSVMQANYQSALPMSNLTNSQNTPLDHALELQISRVDPRLGASIKIGQAELHIDVALAGLVAGQTVQIAVPGLPIQTDEPVDDFVARLFLLAQQKVTPQTQTVQIPNEQLAQKIISQLQNEAKPSAKNSHSAEQKRIAMPSHEPSNAAARLEQTSQKPQTATFYLGEQRQIPTALSLRIDQQNEKQSDAQQKSSHRHLRMVLDLSQLGPIQIDLYVIRNVMHAVVATETRLSPDVHHEIADYFGAGLELAGQSGELVFRVRNSGQTERMVDEGHSDSFA